MKLNHPIIPSRNGGRYWGRQAPSCVRCSAGKGRAPRPLAGADDALCHASGLRSRATFSDIAYGTMFHASFATPLPLTAASATICLQRIVIVGHVKVAIKHAHIMLNANGLVARVDEDLICRDPAVGTAANVTASRQSLAVATITSSRSIHVALRRVSAKMSASFHMNITISACSCAHHVRHRCIQAHQVMTDVGASMPPQIARSAVRVDEG